MNFFVFFFILESCIERKNNKMVVQESESNSKFDIECFDAAIQQINREISAKVGSTKEEAKATTN